MKNCGNLNYWKHRDINNDEQYIALDIHLKFCNMDKMKIKSSERKYYLGISGKGLIVSLGLDTIRRSKKKKKESFLLLKSVLRIFLRLLSNLRICLMRDM